MKVLIVGAGIGGLATALCCRYYGHEVTVFEQARALGEVGAGIQVPPNAMKVFNALGIADKIAEHAFEPEAIEARMGESGRHIFRTPLADSAHKRWGAPYLHLHRADYIAALKVALVSQAPKALRLDAAVVGYQQDATSATVILADGRRFSGDIVIGADGLKSVIREQMIGAEVPVFTGNTAWRLVLPIADLMSDMDDNVPNPTACIWMGRGRHAVTYRLRGGTLINFVGVVEREGWKPENWTGESWTETGSQEEAQSDFEGWHPVITSLLKAAAPDSFYRWALFDRPPLPRWVDGRVALLGDAAHPMLPFTAQGAAMAVEDAWVLARVLASESGAAERPVPDSLKAYQARRYDRAGKAQAASRANMKTFHKKTEWGRLTTYGPMWLAGRIAPRAIDMRMDWLYAYDVTKDVPLLG